jgi:hypothetical protein
MTDSESRTAALEEALRELVRQGPPVPLAPSTAPPVIRRWEPATPADIYETNLKIDRGVIRLSRRHPTFDVDCFSTIAPRAVKRSLRSTYRGRVNRFYFDKVNRELRARSDGEFSLMQRCQVWPACSYFVEEPLWIRYVDEDGKWKGHLPDLFAVISGIPWFLEWKYEKHASLAANENRWPRIGPALSYHGFGYEVLTERHIAFGATAENVELLFSALRKRPSTALLNKVLASLRSTSSLDTPHTIAGLLADLPEINMHGVLSLIYHGVLETDLLAPITAGSLVSVTSDEATIDRYIAVAIDPYRLAPPD